MKLRLIELLQKVMIKMGLFLKFKDAFFSHPAEPLFRIKKILSDSGKRNLIIIDIGAADGMVSYYFSQQFPQSKVISFEPNPAEFKKAVEVNERNLNVEVRNLALSSSPGIQKMHILDNSFSSSLLEPTEGIPDQKMSAKLKVNNTLQVKTSTLDIELGAVKSIDLIKIDTQGTELNILKGATEVLKNTDYILIEQNNNDYYKGGCQYFEVDGFLRENGFELYDIITTYKSNSHLKEFDAIYKKVRC